MDFSVVLNHLQSQFSGQLVLYVDDMAKVLGKSEKAIANLIARKSLPFKIKNVGGHRCVDIYQVAQWLASDGDVAKEAVAVPVKKLTGRKKAATGRPVAAEQDLDPVAPSGLMASKILQMRHDYALPLARFAVLLDDENEEEFMKSVHRALFPPYG